MHRELSHVDEVFHPAHNYALYAFTGLMALLIGADLWPQLVAWLGMTETLPYWPNFIFGIRIALIAAVIGGARILYTSLESLLDGRLGADLAIAIAVIAAILIGEPLVAAEVVFIGLLGECLESFTFERTQRAIRKIVEVCPRRCWLLRDGEEVRVFAADLQVGDIVRVKPGAKVPVDGVVLEGRSAVDTSALTGEALPVDKIPGDEILAGSINQFGALDIKAEKVAEHTVVGRVIELTAQALKSKGNIERTADRMARYFLPIVLGLAAITFLGAVAVHGFGWFLAARTEPFNLWKAVRLSVYPTLAVLVVACPCPLILATPAAIIAALGRLAGTGVLIKGGTALERLAGVSAFAFDKTGTLTEGKLHLGDVVGIGDAGPDEILRIAAAAEKNSEHVIAQLILKEAQNRKLALDEIRDFQAHPGAGVTADTDSGRIVVGNRRLVEEEGISLSDEVCRLLEEFDAKGQTALLVAREGAILGVIGARDRVRTEAPEVLAELRNLGIQRIALLTGDRAAVANSIAAELEITEVHAEQLPQQKAEIVARLGEEAKAKEAKPAWWKSSAAHAGRTAMVGDGINDAPALAKADVGLAIGGAGADIAAEAGDVVFMGDPLKPLPLLLELSRATVRIIRQNIVIFAFGVNIVGIVLTAWLWPLFVPAERLETSPIAAVIYHQFGSLAVLLNSMRLLWFGRGAEGEKRGFGATLKNIDSWMERHLDIDGAMHWLGRRWKPIAAIMLVLALAVYAFSGITQINADETAIVTRFGQTTAQLQPGWHWRFPWPIEKAHRIKPDRIRSVDVGFRADAGALLSQTLSWASSHSEGMRRLPEEAVMLTGDGDLIDVQAIVRYRIADPYVFLFEVKGADEIIRGGAESVLRYMAAKKGFNELLAEDRARIENEALKLLRERLTTYGEKGIGVRLTSVTLRDLHPPPEVVRSYYAVTQAKEKRDTQINIATGNSHITLAQAKNNGEKRVRDAEAESEEKITEAKAIRSVFKEFSKARKAQKDLTDFRLFWTALVETLQQRDLILIDADKVPGRRHLLLLDPEQWRGFLPAMPMMNRNPPPRKELGHEE